MKAIKTILYLFSFASLVTCSNDESKTFSDSNEAFVRFFLLIDNNGDVLTYPQFNGSLQPVSNYLKDDVLTLKIPVTLSATQINEQVNVEFQTEFQGNLNESQFEILPNDLELTFTNGQLVDTIFVKQNNRISNLNSGQLKLELVESSNPNIKIGMPNSGQTNDVITIDFNPSENLIYTFEKSRETIGGNIGEEVEFKILFPNGFLESEIENENLFGVTNAFDVSFVQQPLENNNEIRYLGTLNENLPDDNSYDTLLNLLEIQGYNLGATTSFQINKPFQIERFGNPAINFYDVTDPFYRLRGEYWRVDSDNPGSCEWFPHNVFSVPVIVDATNPNGFQFAGAETPNDTNDDIYHHKFKIGFVGPNSPIGTNPFALRNLLEGESNVSPGLNLEEALEFFPANGNSNTNGTVSVISQIAVIVRSSDDVSFNVPITGSGTYEIVNTEENLWQIDLEVTYDFSAIDGTTRTLPFVLYNQPNQPEPPLSNVNCFEPLNL